MRLNAFTLLSLVALTLSLTASSTRAQKSIGVNFTGGGTLLNAADQPGVVGGANWNNIIGTTGNNLMLLDNTGSTTTTLLTYVASNSGDFFTAPNTPNTATNTLYSGALFGSEFQEVSITLTNIPYARYNVYVYASADSDRTDTLSISSGRITYYYSSSGDFNSVATNLTQTTSTNPGSPTSGPAQYQVFSNLSNSTFSLTTAGSISDGISNNVFGLQIVAAAPEPGSLGLLSGVGILGACVVARSRKR